MFNTKKPYISESSKILQIHSEEFFGPLKAFSCGVGGVQIPTHKEFGRLYRDRWVFPKIGVPQNRWFLMETPIKMDDLGVPPFSETSR